jgi:hypothetical protein
MTAAIANAAVVASIRIVIAFTPFCQDCRYSSRFAALASLSSLV